jgi:3-deoxy-manno-octulosonate cytidylyltransferase (CMP-KDO synthetase)
MQIAIIIPARLASTRLPRKILADIGGKPMIMQVYERCVRSGLGDVWVACDSLEVKNVVEQCGGRAVLTDPDLPSGTDRVYAGLCEIDPNKQYDIIINAQGDVPDISLEILSGTADLLLKLGKAVDIATAAVKIQNEEDKTRPSVVKPVISFKSADYGRALYFTRATAPTGTDLYEHIGIYAFWRDSLEKFVKLPPSQLEKCEKLEQLRAIENDMPVYVKIVQNKPNSVDTPEDLDRVRKIIP